MSAETKNLEALAKAIEQHDRRCKEPVLVILMNGFEVERLGWEDFRGIPIEVSAKVPSGRFELICDGEGSRGPEREVEDEKPLDAVADDRLVTV
jgi:hypothetical protein